jgi:hypothetical protein
MVDSKSFAIVKKADIKKYLEVHDDWILSLVKQEKNGQISTQEFE